MKNTVKFEFLSLSENEALARSVAAAFIMPLDPTLEELADVRTAVSEAVTNAIVHGYPDQLGKIAVKLKLLPNNTLEITVRDWGAGIEDIQQARQPLFTTGGEERSGMGFTIMESFMDKLTIKSVPGRGTTVTMRKRISTRIKRWVRCLHCWSGRRRATTKPASRY